MVTENGSELPKRKPNRLRNFDYSSTHAYFITVCTKNRKQLFWNSDKTNVGAATGRPQEIPLSTYGKIVDTAIRQIPLHYPCITVDYYVVMPNHIHLLLQIHEADKNGRPMAAPTISNVINHLKGAITRKVHQPIWQKLFHDHVVRDRHDYLKIAAYIENNPALWREDCFFDEDG